MKLEFFNNRTYSKSDFSASQLLPKNRKIGDSQLLVTNGEVEISEEMKVIDLEKLLKDKYSLAVQVFRKSGNLWLETTMTDNWTLKQQNNHGRELSTEYKSSQEDNDYDLNRDADR